MENFAIFISKHMGLFYTFAVTMLALMLIESIRARRNRNRVRPAEAVLLINKKNAVVIDIRNQDSFKSGHIVDALSLPLRDLPESGKKLDKYKNKPMIVVCANGIESQKAAANLIQQGYNAFTLTGGIRAWSSAELPLVKE